MGLFQTIVGKKPKHTENTLIFLDTGFFRHYNIRDGLYQTLLRFSREGKVTLCTSQIALEEWQSQKVEHHMQWCARTQRARSDQIDMNLISDAVLVDYPPYKYPSEEDVEQIATRTIEAFIAEHKICVLAAREAHIKKTFRSYFKGLPPFRGRKEKIDIPDSWVYEAAKDSKTDERFKHLKYRYCIGGDNGLNSALQAIGITPIGKDVILDFIQQEQADALASSTTLVSEAADTATETDSVPEIATVSASDIIREQEPALEPIREAGPRLGEILASALTEEYRKIYLSLIGWAYTLERPTKTELETILGDQGFELEKIRRSYQMLADPALGLFTETGSYLLPLNKEIGVQAQNLIMDQVAGALEDKV